MPDFLFPRTLQEQMSSVIRLCLGLPFSEMKHAGSIQTGDSIPKISTGKLIQEKKKLLLPISISVHHGLVDGRNVAEFIQNLKDGQNNTL